MGRPSKEPPFASSLVPAVVRYALSRGVDVEALAWRFGLPEDVLRRDDVPVPPDTPHELLQAVARALGEPDVALRLAPILTSRRNALAELVVRASATVRDALARMARWAPAIHEGFEGSFAEDAEGGRFVLRTPRRPRGVGRFVHEFALAHALVQVRAGAGEDVATARVWFAHARPPDRTALEGFFGTADLAFGCEDSGFAVACASLDRAMRAADARTVETVEPLVDASMADAARPGGTTFARRVARHVAASLPKGTDVGAVARGLHMGARTLQRRLEDEGTRFTEVLDRARLEVAEQLLADPRVGLTEVASRLGFSDLASFSRAFKRWTGKPPGQWRRS